MITIIKRTILDHRSLCSIDATNSENCVFPDLMLETDRRFVDSLWFKTSIYRRVLSTEIYRASCASNVDRSCPCNSADGTVSVRLGNGDGTFQAMQTYPVGPNPQRLFLADLRNNGKLDIVTMNFGDNTVSVLRSLGNGTFAARVDYPAGNSPRSVAAADFNGDGKLDLAVANKTSNAVSILLGNGNGSFQAATAFATGSAPQSVAAADLNGLSQQLREAVERYRV